MRFGLGYFPTDDALTPGELARLLEERGHESLFFAEHSHIPASRLAGQCSEQPPGHGMRPPRP